MIETFYVIECRANGVDVEFHLNGIPIVIRGPKYGQAQGCPVNHNIIDGVNEISMVVRPGPVPSQADTGPGGKKWKGKATSLESAHIRLSKYPHGSVVGGPEGVELVRIDWPVKDEKVNRDDFQEGEFPFRMSAKIELGQVNGPWQWQSAPRLSLEKERAAVTELLTRLHTSLNARDPEPFLEASALRLVELGKAYGKSPRNYAEAVRKITREDTADEKWGLEPLKPEEFDLRTVADGRMIECIAKDWRPILREKPAKDGSLSHYHMTVARIAGELRIVR
jgi:hypothetical protein